ncbi:hypothetical protein TRIP_C60355 [Candidatus Zixiibacteriota bacterium]|nr:hypothetical protein TRIP_C60355 [candidate division Zixibacteria bacterium]
MLKPIEKFIKAVLLRLTASIWPKRSLPNLPIDIAGIGRILIYRPEKIGDFLMVLPLVSILKKKNPSLSIDAVISPAVLPLITNDPRFNKIFLFSRRTWHDFKSARDAKKIKYDIIFDLVGSDSYTAAIATLYMANGRAITISVGKKKLSEYYGSNFDIYPERHMIESTLQPLSLFGLKAEPSDYFSPPAIDKAMIKRAEKFCSILKNKGAKFLVGINISAGNKNRRWADENYSALMQEIINNFAGYRIVIFAVSEDFDRAYKLTETVHGATIIPEELNIREVAAIVGKLDLFISPDTSLIHVARGLHIPVVGLYIPFNDNYRRWGPLAQKPGMLIAPRDDAINEISPSAVLEEIRRVLEEA